jgi:hypothetical protein
MGDTTILFGRLRLRSFRGENRASGIFDLSSPASYFGRSPSVKSRPEANDLIS